MIITDHIAAPSLQQDPPTDPHSPHVPQRTAAVLLLLQILTAYGRYLAAAVPHRSLWRGFATVAQFFGTAAVPDIAARVQRGIMRALALQSVLLQRARRGRDLVALAPPLPHASSANPPASPQTDPKPPLAPDTLPTQAELEAWVRRRPIGHTLTDICLDLGVSPSLCAAPFWNRLFDAMQDYGGSIVKLFGELHRREDRFESEDWTHPTGLPVPEYTRPGIRQTLGFFVSEPPVDPFRPSAPPYSSAALATGQP